MTEDQDTTFELTLKLTLPGNTLKKLKSYAMLSGMAVDELEKQLVSQVEPELSAHFDKVLTEGIVNKLSEMDGIELRVAEEDAKEISSSLDDGEHQLSGDDLEESPRSLEEQYSETGKKRDLSPAAQEALVSTEPQFIINVPDAGADAEKFLDTAFSEESQTAAKPTTRREQGQGPYGVFTGAAKRFSPGSPRVKISEHTGEESGYFS